MKKQYLIGLLGIAAISIPMGSTLYHPSVMADPINGQITLSENSEIKVFDMDQKKEGLGTVSVGDTLQSVHLEGTYTTDGATADEDYTLPPESYTVSDGAIVDTKSATFDHSKVKTAKGYNADEGSFSLDINSKDNSNAGIWEYTITEQIINNGGYDVSVNSTFVAAAPAGVVETADLGTVKFSDEVVDNSVEETTVVAQEVSINSEKTEASVSYDIELAANAAGIATETIKSIEWIDLGEDGLVDDSSASGNLRETDPNDDTVLAKATLVGDESDLSGTLISDVAVEPETTYNKSLIRVETNNDKTPIIESNVLGQYDENGPINNDKDKMGAGAVIGIIIAVLLVVGIIGYGGYYLYKKNVASKD